MPTPAPTYQTLLTQYHQLPWYKKAGFWLSAPRLSWGLFGYKKNPDENRVNQLIQWAKASWFFKTKFEQDICNIEPDTIERAENPHSNYNETIGSIEDVIGVIARYVTGGAYGATSRFHREADTTRIRKITNQLLLAVAYGMESKETNEPVKASDAGNLFKSHLYAKELLQKSPKFLLERGDVTDWAGRTFKNITAFEYALWAKDFKMIEMMLHCIPESEAGDAIRETLLEQYKQVTTPVDAGGGLTYTHTYDRPNLDALGIPDGTTTSVTEEHTENHFDVTPLCVAYQDYNTNFNTLTRPQRDAYWAKLIGKLQRLLPVHILQRYCDPNTPFYPPQFDGEFKRSTNFYNYVTGLVSSLFGSNLSSDFGVARSKTAGGATGWDSNLRYVASPLDDLAAIRQLDEVSTNEIEKITSLLSQPRHVAGPRL
ncbi:hypothetical protein [Legionella adelaidensis]|uniref:hypothetical protein n=1 Tax=Legionella adelaidensis TaxID=45056 RepID=UPI0013EFA2C5|nr:hypothetical protein [Legionella adelaidensis]